MCKERNGVRMPSDKSAAVVEQTHESMAHWFISHSNADIFWFKTECKTSVLLFCVNTEQIHYMPPPPQFTTSSIVHLRQFSAHDMHWINRLYEWCNHVAYLQREFQYHKSGQDHNLMGWEMCRFRKLFFMN